jgi:subtilisin family serine protease
VPGRQTSRYERQIITVLGGSVKPMLPALHPSADTWLVPLSRPSTEGLTGKGVRIVIVDTGVLTEHPNLRGRVTAQVDLTGEGVADEHGHGTAVAAIAAGIATGAEIMSVKAIGRSGDAGLEMLAEGIREAGRQISDGKGGLINVSAGRSDPICDGECPLCQAVAEAQRLPGVIVVAASGNEEGPTYCPAREAISVETPESWDAPGDLVVAPPSWKPNAGLA